MVIDDHINLMGGNPLIGVNDDRARPAISRTCPALTTRGLIECSLGDRPARELCRPIAACYVAVTGPNLETRAEYRFLRTIGADVVGMSTVPEVIVAVHAGMRVLGLSIITDMCLPDALEPANIDRSWPRPPQRTEAARDRAGSVGANRQPVRDRRSRRLIHRRARVTCRPPAFVRRAPRRCPRLKKRPLAALVGYSSGRHEPRRCIASSSRNRLCFDPRPPPTFPRSKARSSTSGASARSMQNRSRSVRGHEKFVFYEGPPTANGMPHPGHCLTRAIKDLFPRYHTMRGRYCERKAGWDTHGLPVEVEVCKELGIHSKEEIEAYGIEPFIHRCQQSVWRYMQEWERLTERIGFWVRLDEAYVTYHQSYVESVWWSLKNLFDRGLLYQGHKIVWWWAQGGTALSSGEVGQGYREVADPSVYVRFPLVADDSQGNSGSTKTPACWSGPPRPGRCRATSSPPCIRSWNIRSLSTSTRAQTTTDRRLGPGRNAGRESRSAS